MPSAGEFLGLMGLRLLKRSPYDRKRGFAKRRAAAKRAKIARVVEHRARKHGLNTRKR